MPQPFTDRHLDVVTLALAERIRQRRLSVGLSVDSVANSLGIPAPQLERYEDGSLRLSATRLVQLGRILKVPVSFFFEGIDAWAEAAGPAATYSGGNA